MSLNPTARMGTAEEVAAGVVFLASPVASRISGTNLIIDGALTKAVWRRRLCAEAAFELSGAPKPRPASTVKHVVAGRGFTGVTALAASSR